MIIFLYLTGFAALRRWSNPVIFFLALYLMAGCIGTNGEMEGLSENKIDAYRLTWWQLPNIENSKTGNFGRPDYGIVHINNGKLNLRYAMLEGRDLGDYILPYWPIRSFVSIYSHPVEIAHRCTLRINNGQEEFLFRTGDYAVRTTASYKRVDEGYSLSRTELGDILKINNSGKNNAPLLMEHYFVMENGKARIPVYLKATNSTGETFENVEVEMTYSQDFNWSEFAIAGDEGAYSAVNSPDRGTTGNFYAWSSGMAKGYEFTVNEGSNLSYSLQPEMNAWKVSIKNTPVNLAPGESVVFSYTVGIIDRPLEEPSPSSYMTDNELAQISFTNKTFDETRTAKVEKDNRVMIGDVIKDLKKPKVRGFGYLTGGENAGEILKKLKDWNGNLTITRSNNPGVIAQGHDMGIEMLLRGPGSYKTGEPISFGSFFDQDIPDDGYPDGYGQDEDHYYWYPVKPFLDFEQEFGKSPNDATLEEKVAYWSRCFVEKWQRQLDNVREHDPDGEIWFYAPSPGLPHVDPFDYYDLFLGEVASLGEDLTVFPFYYGIDYDVPEYMMRRWKEAGVHRAVFLPGGPTYARPTQFFKAISSARRGGADGTCGFGFTLSDEFDDQWRWKALLLASQANFPTPELDAYCFIEEPGDMIEKLAASEVIVVSNDSGIEEYRAQLESVLPKKVLIAEKIPHDQPTGDPMTVVVGEIQAPGQEGLPYDLQELPANKGVIQMSGNTIWINGSDLTGLQYAKKLFLRFAELGGMEKKCRETEENKFN